MKGIVLAAFSFLFFLSTAVLLLRVRQWGKQFWALILAFGLGLLYYLWVYLSTPPDVWYLPREWLEPWTAMDFANGVVIFTLLFHFFWDFLYAVAITGFSTGLLVRLERSLPRERTVAQLERTYLTADGTDQIFARRLPNLIGGGYLRHHADSVELSLKGRIIAVATLWCKKLLNAGEGG